MIFVMALATVSLLFAILSVFLDSKTDAARVPKWLRILAFKVFARLLCLSAEVPNEARGGADIGHHRKCSLKPEVNNRVSPIVILDDQTFTYNSQQKVATTEKGGNIVRRRMNEQNEELRDIMNAVNDIKEMMKDVRSSEEIVNEWKLLARILDRLMFWISVLVVVIYFAVVVGEMQRA